MNVGNRPLFSPFLTLPGSLKGRANDAKILRAALWISRNLSVYHLDRALFIEEDAPIVGVWEGVFHDWSYSATRLRAYVAIAATVKSVTTASSNAIR